MTSYDHWKTTEPDDGLEPPISDERFDVWQYFEGDWHERVGENLDAKAAVELAHSYTTRPAALLGIIQKVRIISLDDDSICFEWQHGKGVTFK